MKDQTRVVLNHLFYSFIYLEALTTPVTILALASHYGGATYHYKVLCIFGIRVARWELA